MTVTPELLLAFAGGLAVGSLLLYLLQRRVTSGERERAEQLAAELDETREELDEHREEVAKHFRETSQLFRSLTEQYTHLYAHLAEGAREFCAEDVPALAQGLEAPLLAAHGGSTEASPAPKPDTVAAAAAATARAFGSGPEAAPQTPEGAAKPAEAKKPESAAKPAEVKKADGAATPAEGKKADGAATPPAEVPKTRPEAAGLDTAAGLAGSRPAQANGGMPPAA